MSVARWKRRLNRLDSSLRGLARSETDGAYVVRLYEELLCRAPDAGALSAGARKLGRGLLRRGTLRRELLASAEYRAVAPARGVRNWLRDSPAPSSARSLATAPPDEVWLELTTRCNIVPACVMCGHAADPSRAPRRRDMDPTTWEALLPLLRGSRHVGLHGAGEPLLYPFLFDLLGALEPFPVRVGFNSNGHLMDRGVAARLVERRLGWISFSLDAATSATYLRVRRRPDFEALLGKIRTLREVRAAAGVAWPRIEINMTLMNLNLGEAPAFVELAASLGVDGVMFQELQPGGARRIVAPDGFLFDYREQELAGDRRRDEALDEARARAGARGVQFAAEILYGPAERPVPAADARSGEEPAVHERPACEEPWRRLLVDVEGNVFVCCVQRANAILLGPAAEGSEALWNGRRIRLVREAMFSRPDPACCAGCFRTFQSS